MVFRAPRFLASALFLSVGVGVCLLAAWPAALSAQNNEFSIAVDVRRVVVNVTVLTKDGHLVPNLTQDNFRIFEDDVEQDIASFLDVDRPLNLGLVLDSSRSMWDQREPVIVGAMKLAGMSHEQDEMFVMHFNDKVWLAVESDVGYTRELPHLREALMRLDPDGRTALYDAAALALEHVEQGSWQRQAIVLFSDGGDTASRLDLDQVYRRLRRSDAVLYTIGLASAVNPYSTPKVLRRLAQVSGGEAFFPRDRAELHRVCEKIAEEIRSQYTLVYSPSNPDAQDSDDYRRIRVEVSSPEHRKLVVRTREGYFADGGDEATR